MFTFAHLSVISRGADSFLARIHQTLEHQVLVDGRADVDHLFARLLVEAEASDRGPARTTFDLIGHSRPTRW